MSDTVGVGLVGYGLAGRHFHAPFLKECPGLDLRAIVARSPEKQAQARADFPQARLYDDIDLLLADDSVDLVDLATPHDTHEPMAVAALRAGKHVVTDKIMAPDAPAAQRMLDAARKAGRLISVYQNRRWDCDYLTALRAFEAGLLGELWTVESYADVYRAPSGQWRWQRAHGGGRFRDLGAHLFDQALQFLGVASSDEVEVWADWQYRYPSADVESEVVTHLVFPSGVHYQIHISSQHHIPRFERRLCGSKGSLALLVTDPQEAFLRYDPIRIVGGTDEAKIAPADVLFEGEAPTSRDELQIIAGDWRGYWHNLADVLLRGADLAVKPEQVIEAIKLLDRAAAFDPGPPRG
jgi:predicted dehydrogenase